MKVIAFVASKGGASKTTLVHSLATYAAGPGNRGILLADLDPQKSLRELWGRRGELVNPRLVSNFGKVAESVALLKSAGYDKEFLLVDTPGALIPVMRDAVGAADLVVMPTRPNTIDLKAQEDVIELVRSEGKLGQSLFVLTQTEKGDILDNAQTSLAALGRPVLIMPKRVEYSRAQKTGEAGWENLAAAKSDMKKIWEAIVNMCERSHEKTKDADHASRLH